jgi:hypothetical protein
MNYLMRWALTVGLFHWTAAAVVTPVPMLDCNGLPCVMVTIGEAKPIKLVIDTGDVNSVLDKDTVNALGLTLEPIIGGDGKPVAGISKARAKAVKIGDTSLGDLTVLVSDMKADKAKGLYPDVDGLIAYTAFKDQVLTLNFRNKTVAVSPGGATETNHHMGELTYPTFGHQGPPIVASTGFAVNGHPLTVQVDTMFLGSLLVYPTSVDKLTLAAEAKTTKQRFFSFTDDGVNMLESRAATEAFNGLILAKDAPVYFVTPGVHLPDGLVDGTVGVALLKDSVVILDFHANRFSITRSD